MSKPLTVVSILAIALASARVSAAPPGTPPPASAAPASPPASAPPSASAAPASPSASAAPSASAPPDLPAAPVDKANPDGAAKGEADTKTGSATAGADETFTLASFLRRVAQGNLNLAASKMNVSIAQAQVAVARVFPDPQITTGLAQADVTGAGNPTATLVQLSLPVQIGGQRGARVAVAEASASATEADVDDYFRTLRGGAADAFIDALRARLVRDRKRRTLASLQRLVEVNEQRLAAGDIGEGALLQSRVEAQQFRAGVLGAEGDIKAADLALVQLLGTGAKALAGKTIDVQGQLDSAADRTLDVTALIAKAKKLRPDLKAAERRVDVAEKQVALAHANRVVDLSFNLTWQHDFPVKGNAPLPAADLLGVSVTVPIPFSRVYHGEVDVARATQTQASLSAESAQLGVETEVRQAVTRYNAANAQLKLYTGGVLTDAEKVLEKAAFNYQKGGASLLEVLVAQRTVNDVYLAYTDALAGVAHALVAVQQAAGTWDFTL